MPCLTCRVDGWVVKCSNCSAENAEGKNFCSDCGALLTPQLISHVRSQIQECLRENLKDQKVVDIETSEAIAERFQRWGTWFLVPATILLTVLGLILAPLGLRDYLEFHNTVHQATVELKPKLEQAVAVAKIAIQKAQDAKVKADQAVGAINTGTMKMAAQLNSAQQFSNKASGLESKTAAQIAFRQQTRRRSSG
jgi:hypothetical protein